MNDSTLARLAAKYGTPLYAYDAEVIRERAKLFFASIPFHRKRIYYATKANGNISLLRLLRKCGVHADTFSPGEVFLARRAGFPPDHIIFSGNNASDDDLAYVSREGVAVNIDSLGQIARYAARRARRDVFLRINTLVGAGHHRRVVTGGQESKFGIHLTQLVRAHLLCEEHGLRVVGIHSHIGSGIMDVSALLDNARILLGCAKRFPEVRVVDCGGGFGVPYTGEKKFDMKGFGKKISRLGEEWEDECGRELTLAFEPGRFLLAESGTLVMRVNTVKRNPGRTFIGTDSGFNHFMRHLLYGSTHRIDAIPRRRGLQKVDVCGNLCESGDVFAQGAHMGTILEGDLIVVRDVGAYGFSMASRYNARLLPAEVLYDRSTDRLIRRRDDFSSLL